MAAPALIVADATKTKDGHDLLTFSCWSGDPDESYATEAEDYIRCLALKSAYKTLTFRTADGTLVGVSAFDRRLVKPFEAARFAVDGWHLQVVGISVAYRSSLVASDLPRCPAEMKISEYVLRKTYERMLGADARRVVVTARVHDENFRSIEACKRVQLERTVRESEVYWRMVGDVDPCIGCPAS